MPAEAHVAIALLGAALGAVGIWWGRRRDNGHVMAAAWFLGGGVFLGAALNALDASDASTRTRGLWIEGFFAVAAGAVAVLARRPEHRGIRVVAAALCALMTVSFVALLVWDFDLSFGFHW